MNSMHTHMNNVHDNMHLVFEGQKKNMELR